MIGGSLEITSAWTLQKLSKLKPKKVRNLCFIFTCFEKKKKTMPTPMNNATKNSKK